VQHKNLKRKLKHNLKGISQILAVLMMIVVAVAAGLVLYGWVMGYLDFTTGNAGKAIKIQSIGYNLSDTSLKVYVQNVGEGTVNFENGKCLYVDGLITSGTFDTLSLGDSDITTISWDPEPDFVDDQKIMIRVITLNGNFAEATWTYTE